MPNEPKPVMQYWILAIQSGYVPAEQWVSYADKIILAMDEPPLWILEMAGDSDPESASQRLAQIESDEFLPLDFCFPLHVHLGYRFEMLCKERITLAEFCDEQWAGRYIEEAFYEFFPEVDKVYFSIENEEDWKPLDQLLVEHGHTQTELIKKFTAIFQPWVDEAMGQYQYLFTQSTSDVIAGHCIPSR